LPPFVPPAETDYAGPSICEQIFERHFRPFCCVNVPVVQIATELGNNDRLARCDFHEARIGLAHFKGQTLRPIARRWRGRSIGTESNPVAIVSAWKIILETIPIFLRLIEPVDVPNPLQIIRPLGTHQVDNMPVCCDVPCWAFSGAAVPLAVPAEPLSVGLRPPLDQNR